MYILRWSRCFLFGSVLTLLGAVSSQGQMTPSNVLVLYNQDDPDSIQIADYYAQVHPGVQLLGLTGVTTDEQVTADYYLSTIRPQILNSGKLTNSISTIVTTKGLPLRIDVTESNPTAYTDPFGVSRTVGSGWWKPYSSLESELTTIDEVSTWQQMGDQTYYSQKGKPTVPQPSCNPYYDVNTSFNFSNYNIPGYGGIRLTSRLDGFTVSDVEGSINRAQQAFVLPSPNSQYIVMDDSPTSVGTDRMPQLKTVLDNLSYPYIYNNTTTAVTTASRPVIGYVSHGTNDGGSLQPGYIQNQLNFTLANGAVFMTHESYNAYSFQPGGNVDGQGLVAEWLAKGGTAGVGNVQEPMSGTCYEPNEDQMFKMLLSGYTWGEAAWSSIQQLSYVNTVVGDPLMTWKTLLPGDANMDGTVGSADLAILGANWGKTGQPGGAMWGLGDFNCDGVVGSADLALLGADWGKVASWADSTAAVGPFNSQGIPEPSTLQLALVGFLLLLGGCRCRRRWFPWPSPNRLGKTRRFGRKMQAGT